MTDNSATATGQQENANLTHIVDFEVKNRGKKPMKARLHYGEKVSLVIDYERGRTIAVVDLTEPLRQVRAKAGSAASAKAIEAERGPSPSGRTTCNVCDKVCDPTGAPACAAPAQSRAVVYYRQVPIPSDLEQRLWNGNPLANGEVLLAQTDGASVWGVEANPTEANLIVWPVGNAEGEAVRKAHPEAVVEDTYCQNIVVRYPYGEPTPAPVVTEPVPAPEPKQTPKKPESELVGYIRRSRSGGALKISISADAFQRSRRYVSQDGHEYVGLVVSLDKVRQVMEGAREVTSVCQIVEGA